MKSVLNIHWKDWCWSWSSNTLATWCEELTHLKRPWCWERLKAGGEGDNRGWNGWMSSPTQWTWVWASPGSWWWTVKPGVLQSMGSQRVRHNWGSELTELHVCSTLALSSVSQSCPTLCDPHTSEKQMKILRKKCALVVSHMKFCDIWAHDELQAQENKPPRSKIITTQSEFRLPPIQFQVLELPNN